ncbi:acyltransferase family protein [Cellulosimicrobium arenosum]|uniref:Acyltransferase n=1 Tax=Cellulosimicrobium arenosum TaxID=2708133 RepID=A0A927IZQ4_9MICO|nr:acyltransferase [Cellulosimicrobium arenosum]MBD8078954.1 acyltransferase [Cellulosimicrobium arenosum]
MAVGHGTRPARAGRPVSADRPRERWMDVVRGVSVLFVVLSHATLILAETYPVPAWMLRLDVLLMPYRMPALMALSGMLLPLAFRKPLVVYYVSKARTLLWPYLVWVLVLAAVGNLPGPILDPRTWYATSYLWFIFFLLCYFTVAPLVRLLPRWGVVVLVLALISVSTPLDVVSDGRTKSLLYLGGFFFAGYALTLYPGLLRSVRARRPLFVVLGLAPVVLVLVTGAFEHSGAYALLSSVGVLGVIAASMIAVDGGRTGFVELLGRNSVVVYVTHFPLLVLLVDGAARSGAQPPSWATPILVLALFVLAVAVAYGLVRLRHVRIVGWLFEWPSTAVPRRWVGVRRTDVPPAAAPELAQEGTP